MDVLSDATCATEEENSNCEVGRNGKYTKDCESTDAAAQNIKISTFERVTSSSDGSLDLRATPRATSSSIEPSIISSKSRRRRTVNYFLFEQNNYKILI